MQILPSQTSADESVTARIAVLPIGSFEQHGAFLPLATDTMIACAIAAGISAHYELWQLPPITLGCSHEHAGWPGTLSISAATLAAVVRDVAESAKAQGADRLVLVNGHGGNYVLSNVVQEANVSGPVMTLFPGRSDWIAARRSANLESSQHDDMHAGELETSILLHAFPETVRPGFEATDHVTERPHLLTLGMKAYTASGVIGRPSLATAAKGSAIIAALVDGFAAHMQILLPNNGSP